jgi:hypothetical protein
MTDTKDYNETVVEEYLRNQVKKIGGIAYKFTSPMRRSVPDRICVFPGDNIWFVECKAPGKKPTQAQYREMARLIKLGCKVCWVDCKESVDMFTNYTNLEPKNFPNILMRGLREYYESNL